MSCGDGYEMPIRRVSPLSHEAADVTRAHPQAPLLRPPAPPALDPRPALPPRRHRRAAGRHRGDRPGHGQRTDGARLEGPPALVRPGLARLVPASPSG